MRYTSATGEQTVGAGTEVIFKEPLVLFNFPYIERH